MRSLVKASGFLVLMGINRGSYEQRTSLIGINDDFRRTTGS